jgi:hypothetical protein
LHGVPPTDKSAATMKSDGWYYGVGGGEVHGPLPMETIRAAVSAGRLPEDAAVSHHATGPWAPLSVVSKLGEEAFGAGGKNNAKSSPRSVAGLIEVFGFVIIAIGLACIVGVFVAFHNDSPQVYPLIVMAISNLVSGLMFLALAEVLRRLGEIAAASRNSAGH